MEPEQAVGNADDSTLSDAVGEHLRSFLHSHFPSIAHAEIEAEWTGVLGFTADGFPLVGGLEVEGRDGVLVAAGFCGHGMPQCFGVGKVIARMIQAEQRGGRFEEALELPQYVQSKCSPSRFLRRAM